MDDPAQHTAIIHPLLARTSVGKSGSIRDRYASENQKKIRHSIASAKRQ